MISGTPQLGSLLLLVLPRKERRRHTWLWVTDEPYARAVMGCPPCSFLSIGLRG